MRLLTLGLIAMLLGVGTPSLAKKRMTYKEAKELCKKKKSKSEKKRCIREKQGY